MIRIAPIEELREKVKAAGYSGLYCEGECGCAVDDLAPCDSMECEDDEEFVNGCEGGHKHTDPDNADLFVISPRAEPPNEARWQEIRAQYADDLGIQP